MQQCGLTVNYKIDKKAKKKKNNCQYFIDNMNCFHQPLLKTSYIFFNNPNCF